MAFATAFQPNAFENNAFQIVGSVNYDGAHPFNPGGSITGGSFSRGRWRKLKDEIDARRALARDKERRRQLVREIVEKAEARDKARDAAEKLVAQVEARKAEAPRRFRDIAKIAEQLRSQAIEAERARQARAAQEFRESVDAVLAKSSLPYVDGFKAAVAAQWENRRLQALISRRQREVEDEEAIMAFLASDDD